MKQNIDSSESYVKIIDIQVTNILQVHNEIRKITIFTSLFYIIKYKDQISRNIPSIPLNSNQRYQPTIPDANRPHPN